MAKFCVLCGKPLNEGETCACTLNAPQQQINQQTNQQVVGQTPQQTYGHTQQQRQQNPQLEKAGVYGKNLFQVFLSFIKNPVNKGKEFVATENYKMALGFIGVEAIMTLLFSLVLAIKINYFMKAVGGGIFSSKSMEVSILKLIPMVVIAAFAMGVIYAGILYVGSIIIKNNVSFQAMLCTVAVKSMLAVCISVVATVVGLFSLTYGLYLFGLIQLLTIPFIIEVYPSKEMSNTWKKPLMFAIVFVVVAFAMSFIKGAITMNVYEGFTDSVNSILGNLLQ